MNMTELYIYTQKADNNISKEAHLAGIFSGLLFGAIFRVRLL
jgi:membrane associated rhomboid family serine protease